MLRRWLLVGALVATSATAVVLGGCARTLSPVEVQALGKHSFPGHKRAVVVKAATTALRTLGYEVVVSDADSGQIKTAPKPLVVTAAGTASSAIAVSNDLAWSLEVTEASDGSVVQATPRATSGGQSYDGPMDAEYMEKAFSDLFKEIESDLPKSKAAG